MDNLMTTDACTMPTAERPLRLAEFDDLFVSSLTALTTGKDGVRMKLHGDAGLYDRVKDLATREATCCSFFTFIVDGTDTHVDLSISVPPARQDILNALAARATEVSGLPATAAGGA
jgi:hypothetical protein